MRLQIKPLAGYCTEKAIWQLLRDISQQMLDTQICIPTIDNVYLEDDTFCLDSESTTTEAEALWYLGALVSKLSSGHEVFGGRGIDYQETHKNARLPELCKDHANITPIVHACMSTDKNAKKSLLELNKKAKIGLEDCIHRQAKRIRCSIPDKAIDHTTPISDCSWPEEME